MSFNFTYNKFKMRSISLQFEREGDNQGKEKECAFEFAVILLTSSFQEDFMSPKLKLQQATHNHMWDSCEAIDKSFSSIS